MANPSIFAAFERMWQHILTKFDKTVSVDVQQNFTEAQKQQARTNIGIGDIIGGSDGNTNILIGTTDEITPMEAKEACETGIPVILFYNNNIDSDVIIFSDFKSSSQYLEGTRVEYNSTGLYVHYLGADGPEFSSWYYSRYEVVEGAGMGTLSVSRGGTGYSTIEDTTYTIPRYRASALVSTETSPTTNGVINWVYE